VFQHVVTLAFMVQGYKLHIQCLLLAFEKVTLELPASGRPLTKSGVYWQKGVWVKLFLKIVLLLNVFWWGKKTVD